MKKCIIDFWGGKRYPKEQEAQPSMIQASVLASIQPLTSAGLALVDGGLEDDPEMMVKGNKVLLVI